MQNKVDDHPDDVDALVGVSRNPKSHVDSKVVVDYASGDITITELKDYLPDFVDGVAGSGENSEVYEDIPVEVRSPSTELHNCYEYEYRPVPGGCRIEVNDICTLCSPAYDTDHSEYIMLTAGHCVDFDSNVDIYQYDNTNQSHYMGYSDKTEDDWEVDCGDYDIDAATLRLDDVNHTYDIAGNLSGSHYRYPIYGIMGWDWIKDHDDCSEKIQHQGRSSCRFETCITETFTNQTYHIEDTGTGGDSGGPHFNLEWNEHTGTVANLTGLYHCIRTYVGFGYQRGKATYIGKVENELNVTV